MSATVETVAEQLDMAAIMPAEKVVSTSTVARSVTLPETDTGKLLSVRHRYPNCSKSLE